jgi:hypothetical protein
MTSKFFIGLLIHCATISISAERNVLGSIETPIPLTISDTGHAESEAPPLSGRTPQYPVQFVGFDGSTWYYQSDCCVDGHYGMIASPFEIAALGCESAAPIDDVEEFDDLQLKEEKGNEQRAAQKLLVGWTKSFLEQPSSSTVLPRRYPANKNPFADYYGGGQYAVTSVKLKDSNGQVRFFTLVKFHFQGTSKSGQDFDRTFPVLLMSRPTNDYEIMFNGVKYPIRPDKDVDGTQISVKGSFDEAKIEVIEVELPKVGDPNTTEKVKCLMIIRKPKP